MVKDTLKHLNDFVKETVNTAEDGVSSFMSSFYETYKKTVLHPDLSDHLFSQAKFQRESERLSKAPHSVIDVAFGEFEGLLSSEEVRIDIAL